MKITPGIKAMLIAAIDEAGSISDFAAQVGLSVASISRYRSGEIKSFSHKAWEKIRPAIEAYMKPELSGHSSTDMSVDEQLIIRKYRKLSDEMKIQLAEFIDSIITGQHPEGASSLKAAEQPSDYKSR